MSFGTPISIKEAINNVDKKKYFLPAIQREFVWSPYQIERLFDSLMRDYPISSFLFWEIDKENIGKYQFYEFVREYHERDKRHNPRANIDGESGITAILDGQQRLTSLYIGLKGTYASKLPKQRWNNDSAFPKRRLCLNLVALSKSDDFQYDFKFLTEEEQRQADENHFWFVVGDILTLTEQHQVNSYLIDNGIYELDQLQYKNASKTLFKLHNVVYVDKSINFFLEKDESLDKVLNIFIRVNSGGTKLSYSDLLLSMATAQWKDKDRDAREVITTFVDEINRIGDGFNINKDFVLKSCLVLSELKGIAFKVDNFNQENIRTIEKKWDDIAKAIKASVDLLACFGYHRDTLTSNNALIPIATYLYKIGSPDNFSESSKYEMDRQKIFKWLVMVLLKQTFSSQPDNVLRPMRKVINNSENGFPFDEIIEGLRGGTKAMSFGEDEVENLLDYKYGKSYTYSVLAFIYPTLDFRNKFHQDHIFPKKLFAKKKLKEHGIADEDIEFYQSYYNNLANIQLLEGIPNQEKSSKDFDVWIKKKYPNEVERRAYMERNYIPDVDLSLKNFREFVKEREKLIVLAFKDLLDQKVA